MSEESSGLYIEPKPEISVFHNDGGGITIRIREIDLESDKERLHDQLISIPVEYAEQIGQALIKLSASN